MRNHTVSGWTFDDGISFTFPDDTGLGAGEYAVIARSEANDDPEVERPNDWFADGAWTHITSGDLRPT